MSTDPNPIARAWSWSCRWSPILNALRFCFARGYPNRSAMRLIDDAHLPDLVDRWIRDCVSRTRLWRWERAEVARELIAHAQDALDHGGDPGDVRSTMGDPGTLAKLVRRSMKRKRPALWRFYRNASRALGLVLLLLVGSYLVMVVRFYLGEPTITTNYIAQLNDTRERYDESDYAWPVYRDIQHEWRSIYGPELERQTARAQEAQEEDGFSVGDDAQERHWEGIIDPFTMTPQHPDYDWTVALYRSFRPNFDRLIAATDRSILGVLYTDRYEDVELADGSIVERPLPPSDDPSEQGSVVEVLLPHLGTIRSFSKLLMFDALIAARDGDSDRAVRSIRAVLALTRQLEREPGFIISDLVSIAIVHFWGDRVRDILHEHPDLFTTEQLTALAHDLSAARDRLTMTYGSETMFFRDFMQRAFTDDGQGNGRITPAGLRLLREYSSSMEELDTLGPLKGAITPASLALIGDRKSLTKRYNSYIAGFESVLHDGPEASYRLSELDTQIEQRVRDAIVADPIDLMIPALGRAVERVFQARTQADAHTVMLALEVHHLKHSGYPETLDALIPHALPEVPEDPMNPGQALRYTRTSTGYVIYSVGSDGDDDNAHPPKRREDERDIMQFQRRFNPGYTPRYDWRGREIVADAAATTELDPLNAPDCDWILLEMDRAQPEE
jgi:hypothetical protein